MKGFITGNKRILDSKINLIQQNDRLCFHSSDRRENDKQLLQQGLTFIPNPGNVTKQKNSDDGKFWAHCLGYLISRYTTLYLLKTELKLFLAETTEINSDNSPSSSFWSGASR